MRQVNSAFVSSKQNMNFKIQKLAGKKDRAVFERFYENHKTLGLSDDLGIIFFGKDYFDITTKDLGF